MKIKDVQKLIEEEPDFVFLKKFDYSLEKTLEKFPNGVPVKTIAQALLMTEEEVEDMTEQALSKIREMMKLANG